MITCILNFLNSNAGAITAIATVILTILTAIYVRLTRTLAKETKRQADLLLNERKSQLNRELTENIYVPLSKAIIPLQECLFVGTPPVFNEWRGIKEEIPFLAYRIKKNLFERLDALADIHSKYFSSYENRSKELEDIIREHFRELTFIFTYGRDEKKAIYISYLQLIFSKMELKEHIKLAAGIQLHSQEIDEELIEYAGKYNDEGYLGEVLSLDGFKRLWDKVKNKIKQNRDLADWLMLKQELVSKSTDVLADLEELIKSNSDNAI